MIESIRQPARGDAVSQWERCQLTGHARAHDKTLADRSPPRRVGATLSDSHAARTSKRKDGVEGTSHRLASVGCAMDRPCVENASIACRELDADGIRHV